MSLGLPKCLELNFRGLAILKTENFSGEDPGPPPPHKNHLHNLPSYAPATGEGKTPEEQKTTCNVLFVRFPFVRDAFNSSIKGLFKKYEIPARLVNPGGQTLFNFAQERKPSQRTCRSSICPQPSICQWSSVVYEATCRVCGHSYIGMTSRRLHDRVREHMASAPKNDEKTAFGVHYEAEHLKQKPKISFSVLSYQRDILCLRVEEAMAIKSRKPELSHRQEELWTGFLP